MSILEIVDCQQCLGEADRDRFYYDLSVFGTRDTKTGWILGIHYYRDVQALQITDDAGSLLARIYCSVKTRPLDSIERRKFKDENVVAVITWSVTWPVVYDAKPAMPGLTRQYIVDFFCFYKSTNGVGKYVDGIPKDAIVYVEIIAS